MPSYSYTAVRPDGKRVKGVQKSKSILTAEATLFRRGMREIQLKEKKGLGNIEITQTPVKREELMHLSRQLSSFIRAGLPVIEGVRVLTEEAANPTLKRTLTDIEMGLRRGDSFADCLERHPKVFPEFYRGILRSSELTGKLDSTLDQLALYVERDLEARRKIKSAMTYPAILAVMAVGVVVILAVFVLPRFEVFFTNLGAKLPWETRLLLWITNFIGIWWWALISFIVGGGLILTGFSRTRAGKAVIDRMAIKMPMIGQAVQFSLIERFCRVLSSMAGSGVSLPEAMRVATNSLNNTVYANALAEVSEAMVRGEGLAVPLGRSGVFPAIASRMIRVGEETGTLGAQLEFTARYYETELDYKLKQLTGFIEPVVVIGMGGVVGFVAVALVSAMYGIYGQVQV